MSEYKYCNKCGCYKIRENFYKKSQNKDGLSSNCKECDNKCRKNWAENNQDKDREYKRNWDSRNKEKKAEYKREWRKQNRDKDIEYTRRWQSKNPEWAANYIKQRRRNDDEFRLKENLKCSLRKILERTGSKKKSKTFDIMGYDANKLKERLEFQFQEGMSWDNYGEIWEIDHIISIQHFLNKGETRPNIINALSNLRPLWVRENRNKGGTFYKDYYGV